MCRAVLASTPHAAADHFHCAESPASTSAGAKISKVVVPTLAQQLGFRWIVHCYDAGLDDAGGES